MALKNGMSGFDTSLQQRRWQFAQRANVDFQTAILHHGVLADLVIDLQKCLLIVAPGLSSSFALLGCLSCERCQIG